MHEKVLILYVPVLHQGYINLFQKVGPNIETIYILDKDLISEFTYLEKEIRAIDPELVARCLYCLGFFRNIRILKSEDISHFRDCSIVLANDSLSRKLAEKYLKGFSVSFEDVFLRWDEFYVDAKEPVGFDRISENEFDREMMVVAEAEAQKSSDWWRRVGVVVVKEGKIILTGFNHHLPSEHTPYVFGDIRDYVQAGTKSELTTAVHGEEFVISLAARKTGIGFEGCDMYVTDFPCPRCAKDIGLAGIKRCFFKRGHASFDGVITLKQFGVEIVLVK
ncbi:MAG: deaminase [bacterium]|nr:deaminase [bacterium]